MYKPHYIEFLTPSTQGGGYDEDGNPIPTSYEKHPKLECFLDNSKPEETIYTLDGQVINQVAGIIYLGIDAIDECGVEISMNTKIRVTDQKRGTILYEGKLKGFKQDMFHDRIFI